MLMVKVPRGYYTGYYLCESIQRDAHGALVLTEAYTGNGKQYLGTLVIYAPRNITAHGVAQDVEEET